MVIDTDFTTLAAQLTNFGSLTDVDKLARIQFYTTERYSQTNFTFKFLPAARCKDIYAEEISFVKFYEEEFSDPDWICPDLRQIDIFNNPFLFDKGQNFVMVVNDCPTAVRTNSLYNLTSYSDVEECADTDTIASKIDRVRVSYKIMSQNFNPKEYKD